MAGKNLKVALQVQADLNQAKREIGSLKDAIQDTSKAADAATTSQGKTSKAVAITADEVKKLSGATNLKDGIKQVSDYENWLGKTSVASKNVADSNKLIEKSITSLTPHLTALVGLSGGFIAVAVDTLNKAAELQNISSLSGSNVEQFQYYAAGAKKVGIEQEKLGDIFKDTRDKVGDFIATGGGEMADFFENIAPKVGVTAEQFKKLGGPEALQLYYDSLQKAGVSQNEMVFYMESIADEGSALIPLLANGGAAFKKYGDAAKEAGAILSQDTVQNAVKAKSALGDFQNSIAGVTNTLVANAAPAIVFVAENLDVLVRAGLIVATVFAGRMITSTAAATIAFIAGRIEAIKYQMALASMAGIATTTAARLTALSTVSRLLTAAGGLPGLAIAAAGVAASFLLMPSSAEAATDSLDNQNKTVAELAAEYQKLDQAQQRIAVRDAVQKQEELTQAYKNQQSELASLIEMGTRSSDVSDEQRKKALELVESYKSGKISASQLTAEYQKLNTVKASFRARADEVAVATNNAKQAMDKQNLVIDVYAGKADAAALASNGLSSDLNSVGSSADSATTKVNGLSKAYSDYMQKLQSTTLSNSLTSGLMRSGVSEKEARMETELYNAKNSDPKSNQTYFVTDADREAIKSNLASEQAIADIAEKRRKQEEAATKEKEKQKKIAEQTAKINSQVMAYADKYNFSGVEEKYGLPNGLIAATAMQESRGNRFAESPAGAKGLMQLMPATASRFGVTDRTNVPQSIEAAAKYYQFLLKKFNGDLDKAIMAYNAGEGNVDSGKAYSFKETQKYLPAVKKYLAGYNGLLDENAQANLSKMVAAENELQKQQVQQEKRQQANREFYYTEEQKALAEHNSRLKEINEAGHSQSELADLTARENKRYEDVLSKRPEILKRVQDSMASLNDNWLRTSDNGLQADLNAVDDKWKQPKADLASLMMSESNPLQANEYQQMLFKIDFVIDKEKLTLQFNDAMKQLEELQSLRTQRQENLKFKNDSGQISQFQFSDGLQAIDAEMLPTMQSLAEQAKILAENLGDAFSVAKIENFTASLVNVDTESKKFLPTLGQIEEKIAGGMTDAIMAWADGTQSANDAFREFASSFLREIAQMILQQIAFNTVKMISKALGGYADGGLVSGFAIGGYTGAGGKYQPAGVVHKDEFVIRKESTSQAGAKEFLSSFNRYGMDALNKFKGYADGGLVASPNISVPDIQAPKLNNPVAQIADSTSFSANQNFYLVDDPARILDVLKSGASQENLVVMMSRDPAKFKSALKIG